AATKSAILSTFPMQGLRWQPLVERLGMDWRVAVVECLDLRSPVARDRYQHAEPAFPYAFLDFPPLAFRQVEALDAIVYGNRFHVGSRAVVGRSPDVDVPCLRSGLGRRAVAGGHGLPDAVGVGGKPDIDGELAR